MKLDNFLRFPYELWYSRRVSSPQLGPLIATLYEYQSAYLEPKLKAAGMRWTTFQILATVMAAGNEASQAEVARRLGIAPATLSESVQAHVKQNLLRQEASPTDKRKKILVLTAEAKRQMSKVGKHVQEFEQILTRQISPAELDRTTQSLEKIIHNLESAQ